MDPMSFTALGDDLATSRLDAGTQPVLDDGQRLTMSENVGGRAWLGQHVSSHHQSRTSLDPNFTTLYMLGYELISVEDVLGALPAATILGYDSCGVVVLEDCHWWFPSDFELGEDMRDPQAQRNSFLECDEFRLRGGASNQPKLIRFGCDRS